MHELRKRHCRALCSLVEQQLVMKRLNEKEAELEIAVRRRAELEETVRRMSAEKQIWFDVAKNNEVVASSLHTALEQVLIQSPVSTAVPPVEEGYGDSDDGAHSLCFEEAKMEQMGTDATVWENREVVCRRGGCRVCQEEEVSVLNVLLLPCRHQGLRIQD